MILYYVGGVVLGLVSLVVYDFFRNTDQIQSEVTSDLED